MNYYLRAQEILELVQNSEPGKWLAIIERECAGDSRVREEVEAQLKDRAAAATAADDDLTELTVPGWDAGSEKTALLPGAVVGPYMLMRRIDDGAGAFGEVYLADEPGLKRRVAIKFLRPGIALSPGMLVRFQQECETQAAMNHPNVARVYGNGVFHGRPYLVMEYVDGQRIDEHCREERLPLRRLVELFIEVCEAVRHAHDRGTIHRDIKPSNILVERAGGTAKVIDFGISKVTQPEVSHTADASRTRTIGMIGTPAYMSPEQAGCGTDAHQVDVTAKSDVYALGAVLYQLLTWRLPIDQPSSDPAEIRRRLTSQVPARPSSRLSKRLPVDGGVPNTGTPGWSERELVDELDWIVCKCLEKAPAKRYDTVASLIDDLRRYLSSDWPVTARPPDRSYAARKYYRRNRAAVTTAAVLALVVVVGLAGTTYGLLMARTARAEEAARRLELNQVVEYQRAWLAGLEPQRFGTQLREELLAEINAQSAQVNADDGQRRELDAAAEAIRRADFTKLAVVLLDSQYLSRALTAIRDQLDGQPRVQIRLLTELLRTRSDWGLGGAIARAGSSAGTGFEATGAIEVAELQYKIAREHLSQDDETMVRTMSRLGGLLSEVGRGEDAERFLGEAVSRGRAALGDDALATADAKNALAIHLWRGQQYAESERLLREVVTVRDRLLGPNDRLAIEARMNLGTTLVALGRHDEALAIRRTAVERLRATIGPDDLRTITAEQNLLSGLARKREHTEETRVLADDLVARARRVLGGAHRRTIELQNNRIAAAIFRGDRDSAETYTQEALGDVRAVLGESHEVTLAFRGNELMIAIMPPRSGAELHRTLSRTEQFADDIDSALGVTHEKAIHARLLLANVQHVCGQTDDACELVRQLLPRAQTALGPSHPVTLQVQSALPQVCSDR